MALVKRGLQMGRCVHSGCGMQQGMSCTLCGSPSSCTPRNSLALATSQVQVSLWCVNGLYKGSKRRTKHMAHPSKRTEQRRNATYYQYPIQCCADQHGAYYRRSAANAFLGAYTHRSAATALWFRFRHTQVWVWAPCWPLKDFARGTAPCLRKTRKNVASPSQGATPKRGLRVPNPNSRGHTTKRGLRVPNPNSRGHTTKRGLRVPNPNSRGHTTKRGLRVPNPNSRGHATKRGLRVPNPNSRGHATERGLRVPNPNSRGPRNKAWERETRKKERTQYRVRPRKNLAVHLGRGFAPNAGSSLRNKRHLYSGPSY